MNDVVRIGDRLYGVGEIREPLGAEDWWRFTPLAPCETCEGSLTACPTQCTAPVDDASPSGSFAVVCGKCREPVIDCPDCDGSGAMRCRCVGGWVDDDSGWDGEGRCPTARCGEPGCWHGWERVMVCAKCMGKDWDCDGGHEGLAPTPAITMTDREAREMGSLALMIPGNIPSDPERALIAAHILKRGIE